MPSLPGDEIKPTFSPKAQVLIRIFKSISNKLTTRSIEYSNIAGEQGERKQEINLLIEERNVIYLALREAGMSVQDINNVK